MSEYRVNGSMKRKRRVGERVPVAFRRILETDQVVTLPAGILFVRRVNLDPFTLEGAVAPLAYGLAAGLVIGLLALRVHSDVISGVGAGLFSAWSGWAIAANLIGTPYGYGSMGGDAGRMTALATYFSTTWRPSDAADPSLPSEYPPLYPMMIGRVAAWSGHSAWSLLGRCRSRVGSRPDRVVRGW